MLEKINLQDLLVIDIETVSQKPNFNYLDEEWQELWMRKTGALNKPEIDAAAMYERASIYSEFGKIIVIGLGIFSGHGDDLQLRVKAISGDDEAQILKDFAELLDSHFNKDDHRMVAHNGKEFDFPYICRRMLINGIKIPKILDLSGKKPWDVQHIDTMELWKFGDYKNFTSLNVLAKCFNIPSPKDDIDGSLVGHTYWQLNDLERISAYCKKDIVTTAQILLKFKLMEPLTNDKIIIT
ncbi:MAG: 3'-5' exonuclease [Bacteroidia bacterium]|nr:3'-5' exonuclease [Bacteroidia bacterium]